MISFSEPATILNKERLEKTVKPYYGLVWFFFLALLLLAYLPVLNREYAVSDDFYYLARATRVKDWLGAVMREALLQGRPLDGLVIDFSFSNIHKLADLVYLRLIGILGTIGVALCSYQLLLKSGWQRIQSFCLAVCFVTVPAFQVFVSWAVASPHIFAALLAYCSTLLIDRAIRRPKVFDYRMLSVSAVCMFLAIGLYQPSAMFFWLFAAILLFSRNNNQLTKSLSDRAKELGIFFAVFTVSSVLEIGAFEWAKHSFGTASVLPQRSHLTTHFGSKINWFINGPLVDALNFNRLQPSSEMALLVFLFLAAGLYLYFKGSKIERLVQCTSAISLIPLSYLPNLAIAENFVTYRTEAALTPLLIFYAFLACVGFAETASKSFSSPIVTAVALTVCTASLLFANYNVNTFFVTPQTLELRLIKSQLDGDFGEKRKMNPVLLTRNDTLAPFARYDEFGLPSLCQPWVPEPVIFLLRQGLVTAQPLDSAALQ